MHVALYSDSLFDNQVISNTWKPKLGNFYEKKTSFFGEIKYGISHEL